MCRLGQRVPVQPLRVAELIPLAGLGCLPRGIQRDRLAHLRELEEDTADVRNRPRAHRQRNRALVAVLLAVDEHHRVTVDVLLVGRHVELGHQRIDPVLARPDPGAATIDPHTVVTHFGEGAPADAVPGLQDGHRTPRLFEPQRRREPGESGPDHTTIDVRHDAPHIRRRPCRDVTSPASGRVEIDVLAASARPFAPVCRFGLQRVSASCLRRVEFVEQALHGPAHLGEVTLADDRRPPLFDVGDPVSGKAHQVTPAVGQIDQLGTPVGRIGPAGQVSHVGEVVDQLRRGGQAQLRIGRPVRSAGCRPCGCCRRSGSAVRGCRRSRRRRVARRGRRGTRRSSLTKQLTDRQPVRSGCLDVAMVDEDTTVTEVSVSEVIGGTIMTRPVCSRSAPISARCASGASGTGPPVVLWHSLFVDSGRGAAWSTTCRRTGPCTPSTARRTAPATRSHRDFTFDECVAAAEQALDRLGLDRTGRLGGQRLGRPRRYPASRPPSRPSAAHAHHDRHAGARVHAGGRSCTKGWPLVTAVPFRRPERVHPQAAVRFAGRPGSGCGSPGSGRGRSCASFRDADRDGMLHAMRSMMMQRSGHASDLLPASPFPRW